MRFFLLFIVFGFISYVGVAQEVGVSVADSVAVEQVEPVEPMVDSMTISVMPRLNFENEPREYVIGKLRSQGLKHMNDKLVLATTGLAVGDTVTIPGEHIAIAMRKLLDQRAFSDAKVLTDFRGDTVDITFLLAERLRVANWGFEGIKKNEQKDLLEKLSLRRGSELSDYLMSTSLRLIREYYDEKAFRNAELSYRVEDDSVFAGATTVTFVINKKEKIRIGEVTFEGNVNLPSKKLYKAMEKTKKTSINFFNDTKYNAKNFEEDKVKIADYMHSKGYRDAVVVADSIYDVKPKRMGIWIEVKEGKKYYYRDITWIGNSKYPTDVLQNQVLQLRKGDVYDSETMAARLGIDGKTKQGQTSVSGLYLDDGYLSFVIQPVETVVGDSVDVEIRMVEGRQYRVNRVEFEGNIRTNDHVIRRELETVPGDLYSQTLLVRTYQRLASMGQFDAQSFGQPEILPNMQQETVDIKYSLKEVTNDQFELSGGWGGGMFIASVGVNFTNISLRKFFDKKAWRPYPAGDNQTIGLKIQTNGTYYRALSVNFIEPWLGGRKPTGLNVSFYTSRETNAYWIGSRATKYFGTIGGSINIGKRLRWPDPYFTLSFGLQAQTYNLQDWDYFVLRSGTSNTIALNVTFARNSVDDIMQYPTTGSNISLSLAITPPYSAFNKVDYSDPKLPDDKKYQWIEYHKWKFNAQWFFPLTADNKLVLMARAQFGYLGYYNKYKKSPFEGFQMGGDGLTGYSIYGTETIGLRGYKNNTLTPYANSYGIYANIFSKYTLELRYPLVRQGSTMVYALVFAEAGNAFVNLEEFKPFNLKRSMGVGLRIFLPVLGMLGVDWGYGFDPVIESPNKPSGPQFHFTMGMQM